MTNVIRDCARCGRWAGGFTCGLCRKCCDRTHFFGWLWNRRPHG